MRIATVQGNVTLSRCLESFVGASLRLVDVIDVREPDNLLETLVAWDELSVGCGDLVAVSEGPEAAAPFRPQLRPVDAYVAARLDPLNL